MAFRAPGEYHADWIGSGRVSWALLVFTNGTAADFDVHSGTDATLWNETRVYPLHVERENDGWSATPRKDHETGTQAFPAPFDLHASFPDDHRGSLFIRGDRIGLDLHGVRGVLSSKGANDTLRGFSRAGDVYGNLHRVPGPELGGSVVVTASPTAWNQGAPFDLAVKGASHVEWYNSEVSCRKASPCPTGGGPEVSAVRTPVGYEVSSERHTYEGLTGQDIDLAGHGTVDYVILGSPVLTLGIDGAVRLPLASAEACRGCVGPDNQTFGAVGNITLRDLQVHPGGLRADMGGEIETARFDETPIDPASLTGVRTAAVGAAALGGGLVVLKMLRLLWPALFTRQRDDAALDNERRRRIYESIVKTPGLHVREVLRHAGVPNGAGRHHIAKLVQAGLVVERRHRNSVRLFPSDARFQAGWHEVAVLSDPQHRLVHDWIGLHPGRSQGEIVAAFAASHGWRRGTTRLRVEHLLSEGLLSFRHQGRFKLYFLAKPRFGAADAQGALAPAVARV